MDLHPIQGGGGSRNTPSRFMLQKPGQAPAWWATWPECTLIRFNSFRFLGAKLKQCHLSITIQMVSAEGYNNGKAGIDIRFTEFFNSRTIYRLFTLTRRGPFFDLQGFYRVKQGPLFRLTGFFTESSQAPFFNLQGFYRVKWGPLIRFTGFLQSQARPPFSIYRVFTESSRAPFFDLQGLQNQVRPPFLIYRVFTESSEAPFFDLKGFYRVKPGPLFRFTGFLQNQVRPPFSIYRVFTESSEAPFFDLQGFLQSQVRPPFSIYRVFTGSSEYCFSAIVNTFLHVIYTILQEIFTGSLQRRCCKYMLYILQYIYMFLN